MPPSCTLEAHRNEIAELLAPTLARVAAGPSETLQITDPALLGRTTAVAVQARLPIPAFTNSQMDGYAVRAADIAEATPDAPVELPVGYAVAAGDPQPRHPDGTATPVMTGAPVPRGADTVVPVEATVSGAFPPLIRTGREGLDAVREGLGSLGVAAFTDSSPVGRFVRVAGEDLEGGRTVADAGAALTPSLIGALAASGITEVAVRRRLRALVCSTGDELHQPAGAQRAGSHIPDANGPMLVALLRGIGVDASVVHTPDEPRRFLERLRAQVGSVDFVITTGGVSAGAFEVVREALRPLGGEFHSVAMQPGGPQGFARLRAESGVGLGVSSEGLSCQGVGVSGESVGVGVSDEGVSGDPDTPILCFPGNPVSSFLSAELFLVPVIRNYAGIPAPRSSWAPLEHDVESPPAKHQVRRGTLSETGAVRVLPPGSHLIHDLAGAEVLVHLPVGVAHAAAGTPVEIWNLNA